MENSTIALIILALMLVCYATRIIPIAATSVLGALAMVFTGIISMSTAFAQFVGDVVLLQIGVMIIGTTFFEVGLANGLGRKIITLFGNSEKKLLLVLVIVVAVISAFISNTAAVALFLPILAATAKASGGRIRKKYLYMPIGFAAVIGGNLTLFGSTPQLSVQSILQNSGISGVTTLGVFDMVKGGIPLVLLLVLFYALIGERLQKKVFCFEDAIDDTEHEHTSIKVPLYKQIIPCIVYLVCIVFFITGWLPIGTTAILGAILCVCTGCISEKKALKSVDWTTVIMLGGILGFSSGVTASGLGPKIVDTVLGLFGSNAISPLLMYAIIVLTGVALTSIMSNTAVAAMLTPIGIAMASQIGANVMTFVIGIVFAANISFCTPIATAPVTMTMSAGYRFSDYVKLGGLFTIISALYVVFVIPMLYGL